MHLVHDLIVLNVPIGFLPGFSSGIFMVPFSLKLSPGRTLRCQATWLVTFAFGHLPCNLQHCFILEPNSPRVSRYCFENPWEFHIILHAYSCLIQNVNPCRTGTYLSILVVLLKFLSLCLNLVGPARSFPLADCSTLLYWNMLACMYVHTW